MRPLSRRNRLDCADNLLQAFDRSRFWIGFRAFWGNPKEARSCANAADETIRRCHPGIQDDDQKMNKPPDEQPELCKASPHQALQVNWTRRPNDRPTRTLPPHFDPDPTFPIRNEIDMELGETILVGRIKEHPETTAKATSNNKKQWS